MDWPVSRAEFRGEKLENKERNVLKNIMENEDLVYMVEDKGPSFTKMSKEQYFKAGEKELENDKFYTNVDEDKSETLKS